MTDNKFIARFAHRRAAAVLLAAVALPSSALAQDTVAPPTVLVPSQPAPAAAPAEAPAAAAQSRTTIAPGVVEQAEQEARERAATRRAERPAQPAPVRQRTVARAAPVAAAPLVPSAPVAAASEAPAPALAAAPPPVTPTTEQPAAPVAATTPPAEGSRGSSWLLLAGLGLVAAAIAAFFLLRRRREDEMYETYHEPEREPVAVAEPLNIVEDREPTMLDPVVASPAFVDRAAAHKPQHEPEVHAALEHATLNTPDRDDIDAVLGGAVPQGERPQLELAMRPIRAGINRDEGVVEFELTVANAGGVQAEDVRIGAFMLSGRGEGDSDIERLLIAPPAEAIIAADAIAPGDGTRLDAAVTLPRDDLWVADDGEGHDGFTPIVLADARYRLPDGSEGRTAAAFTIGRVDGGDALIPIALDDEPAMYADIEARLHSVAAKV